MGSGYPPSWVVRKAPLVDLWGTPSEEGNFRIASRI